jgi:hypothetical protein
MRRTELALAAALFLVGCQSSPEGDLKKLGRAVEQGDSAEAVRYLDVERTTAAMVSEVMTLSLKDTGGPGKSDRASQLGREMGEGMVRMMQPMIEGMIKQGVYDVLSGRSVRVPPALSRSGADTMPRDSILQVDPRILSSRSFDDSAFVKVELHPRGREATETLEVKMEHPDKVWRVVRLDGLKALLDSLPK